MKRKIVNIVFSLFVVLITISCSNSNDDVQNPRVSNFSATLGMTSKYYNTISVAPVPGAEANTMVTASVNGSATDLISLSVFEGATGTYAIYGLTLKYNGVTFEQNYSPYFNTNTLINSGGRIDGVFSGTLVSSEGYQIEITNGTFRAYK